jgi:hypothetical protein
VNRRDLGAAAWSVVVACGARTNLENATIAAAAPAAIDAAPSDQAAPDAGQRRESCGACAIRNDVIGCWEGSLCTWGYDRTLPNCVSASDLPKEKTTPCGPVLCDVTLYRCIDPARGVCATDDANIGALPACP